MGSLTENHWMNAGTLPRKQPQLQQEVQAWLQQLEKQG